MPESERVVIALLNNTTEHWPPSFAMLFRLPPLYPYLFFLLRKTNVLVTGSSFFLSHSMRDLE